MTLRFSLEDYDDAADFVRGQIERQGFRLAEREPVGLVLGSGLNPLAEAIEGGKAIAYEEIPHFSTSTGAGARRATDRWPACRSDSCGDAGAGPLL